MLPGRRSWSVGGGGGVSDGWERFGSAGRPATEVREGTGGSFHISWLRPLSPSVETRGSEPELVARSELRSVEVGAPGLSQKVFRSAIGTSCDKKAKGGGSGDPSAHAIE